MCGGLRANAHVGICNEGHVARGRIGPGRERNISIYRGKFKENDVMCYHKLGCELEDLGPAVEIVAKLVVVGCVVRQSSEDDRVDVAG